MPYWDERVEEMHKHVGHKGDKYHIDILAAHFVLNPDKFDVVVGSNLFGDILSDLGLPVLAPSALHHLAILILKAISRLCLSLCIAQAPILRARVLRTRLADMGRGNDA